MLGFKERSMVDKRVQERIFYFWFSPYLTNFLTFVAFNIWVICLAFYTIILNMLSGELESFNNSIKRDLENAPRHDVESILLEKFSSFLKMTDIVLKVNNIFEVYTFVMVGLNIPTSMFTLISFVVGLKASWESAVFSVPTIMFSVIELIGLTAIPAKVHATEVEWFIGGPGLRRFSSFQRLTLLNFLRWLKDHRIKRSRALHSDIRLFFATSDVF
uniref:Uncharacterized protein n=1 Tax=Acrobeloides nanus TaxID=290746 RepID=A0A914EKV6_9BILA